MSREIPSGTPNRSPGYVHPGGRSPLLRISLISAGVVAVALPALYLVGQRRFTSPGPVATHHANVELRCAQCHDVGKGVADLRCERCHDSVGTDRFTHAGHVLFGSANARKASAAPEQPCAVCHADHRGRAFDMRLVDDRQCGTCHRFSSFGKHPEFAAVKAQVQTGLGLSFGHQRHLAEAAKQLGKKCEACHEATADLRGFVPLNFDRHCATCHTKNGAVAGDTDPVTPELLMMTAAGGGTPPASTPAELGRITLTGLKHRDPWVLFNAQRLRRMLDSDGVNAEASALRLQIAYLTSQTGGQPLGTVSRPVLESWRTAIESEIARLDKRIAAPPGPGSDAAALKEIGDAIRQIAVQLPSVDRTALPDAPPAAARAAAAGQPQSAQQLEARRRELAGALDAVMQRGDKGLSDRAAALRKQVDVLQPSNGDPDVATLDQRLRNLDDVFGSVRATADPQAAEGAGQLAALRDLARSQVNGGIAPGDFEVRRRELLAALDSIERSGSPTIAARAGSLRQRVLALRAGVDSDTGLRDERARQVKLLNRVKLELELGASGDLTMPARSLAANGETQRMVQEARTRLAVLESGGRPGTADTPTEIRRATSTLNNLLGPCLKCHVMSGAKMAAVNAADTVFQHARFDHKPHVEQATCLSCHKSVEGSIRATDINEPNVESCMACHKPSRSRSDCVGCHDYHPPSIARLARSL